MELFSRLIRCNNLPALRTLSEQFAAGTMQEPLKRILAQMSFTTESELRWLFSQTTQHYEHLDLTLAPETEQFGYILNRNIHAIGSKSPVFVNLAQGLDLFSSHIHSDSESESDDIEQEIVDAGHIH